MGDETCDTARCDPRVARSRATVLAAASALLAEEGLPGLTVEAVSSRSGVAKTTIYRHWPSRAALVVDAFRSAGCGMAPPDTGDLREDLVALLGGLAAELRDSGWAAALPGLTDAAQRDPELADLQREMIRASRCALDAVIDAAVARGEAPADLDRDHAAMLLGGPLFYRRLVALTPVDEPGLPELIVDAVLPALLRAAAVPR
jgi:AcrR family transcriptional regulator